MRCPKCGESLVEGKDIYFCPRCNYVYKWVKAPVGLTRMTIGRRKNEV